MPSSSHPRDNALLGALGEAALGRWRHELEPVALPLGQVLQASGQPLSHVYFPTTAVVALLNLMENGSSTEIAMVGREGLVGISLIMGGESTPSQAVVQSAGQGYRLPAQVIQAEFHRADSAMQLLLRYTQALITQMAQTAVCNRHHALDQQLCRWLLMSLDRMHGQDLVMTHELIAHMLGVRREGVTEAAQKLQASGLIRYARGHVSVLDRPGLEARTCECYAVVKREYDRLLAPPRLEDRPAAGDGAGAGTPFSSKAIGYMTSPVRPSTAQPLACEDTAATRAPTADDVLLAAARIATFDGSRLLTRATGFFYRTATGLFLVTSRHVLMDEPTRHHPDRIEIELHTDAINLTLATWHGVMLHAKGRALWRQATDSGGEIDVAALPLDEARLPPLAVMHAFTPAHLARSSADIELGSPVVVVGFPLGFHDTVHHLPVVRQAAIASSFGIRFQGQGCFLTDARTHRGTSGAPILRRRDGAATATDPLPWELLGVHSSRLDMANREQQDESLGLNCAWYADILQTLTAEPRSPDPRSGLPGPTPTR